LDIGLQVALGFIELHNNMPLTKPYTASMFGTTFNKISHLPLGLYFRCWKLNTSALDTHFHAEEILSNYIQMCKPTSTKPSTTQPFTVV
jgi:hypothetical protein